MNGREISSLVHIAVCFQGLFALWLLSHAFSNMAFESTSPLEFLLTLLGVGIEKFWSCTMLIPEKFLHSRFHVYEQFLAAVLNTIHLA